MAMVEPSINGIQSAGYSGAQPYTPRLNVETPAERALRKLSEIQDMCAKYRDKNDSLGWVISAVAWLLEDRIDQLKREANVSAK